MCELTCLVQRWPWRGDLDGCAFARSSHRRTSHRRLTFHRYPVEFLASRLINKFDRAFVTYVATGEVTSLEHELRNNSVEGRASISETLLTSAESTEVLGGLWDYIIVKVESDSSGLLYHKESICQLRKPRGEVEGGAKMTTIKINKRCL